MTENGKYIKGFLKAEQEIIKLMGGLITKHCIGNIEIVLKNDFIKDIKIKLSGNENSTIGEMMEYQKKKLGAIQELFLTVNKKLYHKIRENYGKE